MVALQRRPPRHPRRPSSMRLGARSLAAPDFDHCWEPGCDRDGAAVFAPWEDQPCAAYCGEHAAENGFCRGCGYFSAGFESFDFSRRPGFCSDCVSQMEAEEEADMYDDNDPYDWEPYDAVPRDPFVGVAGTPDDVR